MQASTLFFNSAMLASLSQVFAAAAPAVSATISPETRMRPVFIRWCIDRPQNRNHDALLESLVADNPGKDRIARALRLQSCQALTDEGEP
jgi:hypothetical protein